MTKRSTERDLQWGDIAKAYYMLNGKIGGIRTLKDQLHKQIDDRLIEGPEQTNVSGHYRFTEFGWKQFGATWRERK